MLEKEFSSDSNDEDYKPTEGVEVSEEEGSGDEEIPLDDDGVKVDKKTRRKVNLDKSNKVFKKRSNTKQSVLLTEKSQERKEEEKKKKVDELWADFMKDVTPAGKKKKISQNSEKVEDESRIVTSKVKVVKEFKFAGEIVKVTSEVDANSKEAIDEKNKSSIISLPSSSSSLPPSSSQLTSSSQTPSSLQPSSLPPSISPRIGPPKRPVSGISNILDKITKKPKMSVLNKSLLDWKEFKEEEGIDADLKRHNKGKNGYLEKQAFLQRTDLKQFELEKNIRNTSQRK